MRRDLTTDSTNRRDDTTARGWPRPLPWRSWRLGSIATQIARLIGAMALGALLLALGVSAAMIIWAIIQFVR